MASCAALSGRSLAKRIQPSSTRDSRRPRDDVDRFVARLHISLRRQRAVSRSSGARLGSIAATELPVFERFAQSCQGMSMSWFLVVVVAVVCQGMFVTEDTYDAVVQGRAVLLQFTLLNEACEACTESRLKWQELAGAFRGSPEVLVGQVRSILGSRRWSALLRWRATRVPAPKICAMTSWMLKNLPRIRAYGTATRMLLGGIMARSRTRPWPTSRRRSERHVRPGGPIDAGRRTRSTSHHTTPSATTTSTSS